MLETLLDFPPPPSPTEIEVFTCSLIKDIISAFRAFLSQNLPGTVVLWLSKTKAISMVPASSFLSDP